MWHEWGHVHIVARRGLEPPLAELGVGDDEHWMARDDIDAGLRLPVVMIG
jgi:hypothetical protein